MLPLSLDGITVTHTEQDGPTFAIHAGCSGKPSGCVSCGSEHLNAHGTLQQDIMDLPHHGRMACIHLARKRWKCKDCGTTFLHPLDWIDEDHRATKRFVDRIAELSLERSFSDLAREYGVNEKTIRNIFYRRYEEQINATRFQSPEYMGIDEIKIAGGLRGVITNITDKAGIEFLPKNTSAVLTDYFTRMPDKERVKAVAIDCAQHYRALVYKHFPNAKVVADKYHILRAADWAVDKTRIDMRNSIESRRTKLKLKKDKFILKTREHELTEWERAQVEMWRKEFPVIGVTYDLKEEFYRIYDAKTEAEARLRFHTWRHNIPDHLGKYWAPILVTWGNWEKEIFEYWNHPITNAYTECQNMLTRAIDRIGRGYSFDALRVKLLLAPKKTGIVTSYRSIRRKKAVADEGIRFMSFSRGFEDDYETVKVPVREAVTYGVDLAKLAEWLEEA
jgi:transposase